MPRKTENKSDKMNKIDKVAKNGTVWWKHKIMYQIYPRSFYDSNKDGVGDIPGIIQKLDYLSELGIGGIWLSPVNESPMFDFGYDISDYRKIDPLFGKNEDFYKLIDEAHERDIKIIMDLVLNHTSHLHPWFVESRSSRNNPKADWYIWHDGIKGKPPNNWLAAFGGKAWEWDSIRGQYYLHSHLKEQPDLNWRSEGLRNAVYDDIKFWLDKGVDGFRLDVVNFLTKDDQLRNNPFVWGPNPRPYDMQDHLFDRNRPENHEIIRELRQLMDTYEDRMMVGEVYASTPDPALSASYLGDGQNELHLAFDFSIIYKKKWHAKVFADYIKKMYEHLPTGAWPVITLSNHDQPRSRTRFGGGQESEDRVRVASAFALLVKGTPFLYYGEEIGMENGKIKKSQLKDPVGIKYWPLHPGRDPERTPMLWSGDANAGFSKVIPWLPLNKNWPEINVAKQRKTKGALLGFHQKIIAVRNSHPVLYSGDMDFIHDGAENYLAFVRKNDHEKVYVYLNFSPRTLKIPLSMGQWRIIFSTHTNKTMMERPLELHGYEVIILQQ